MNKTSQILTCTAAALGVSLALLSGSASAAPLSSSQFITQLDKKVTAIVADQKGYAVRWQANGQGTSINMVVNPDGSGVFTVKQNGTTVQGACPSVSACYASADGKTWTKLPGEQLTKEIKGLSQVNDIKATFSGKRAKGDKHSVNNGKYTAMNTDGEKVTYSFNGPQITVTLTGAKDASKNVTIVQQRTAIVKVPAVKA